MDAIVNVTPDWGIGCDDSLLISISADLRRFRALTQGKTVILGRKTLETFPGGKPLKNRTNLILSRDPDFRVEGAEVLHSLPELLDRIRSVPRAQLCVIGGAQIYELLLPYCDQVLLTRTEFNAPANRFFPDLDKLPNWQETGRTPMFTDSGVDFCYIDYVNRSPLEF